MDEPIRLFLVAPDNRFAREIRAIDEAKVFDIIRFRTFSPTLKKATEQYAAAILIQWTLDDVLNVLGVQAEIFSDALRRFSGPLIVYCPDISQLPVSDGESLRFALLQMGATAVFSQTRKLPEILEIAKQAAVGQPKPKKLWTQTVVDSLPWK